MKPPKLPVPPLLGTLSKYLRALEPLVSPQQLRRTKAIADEFCAPQGIGTKLQNFLLKKYRETDCWSHEYFQNRVYLDNRSPIPYLQNIVGVIPQKNFPQLSSMALYVATAIAATQYQRNLIKRGEWPLDKWKEKPLCMEQHENMLRCYRVPQVYRDRQHTADGTSANHVILMHRNQMYNLPLKPLEGGAVSESAIVEIAKSVMSVVANPPTDRGPAVGLLTALNRDLWATTRDTLIMDLKNANNLSLIENSMLVVCLDETVPNNLEPPQKKDIRTCILQMFHGGGVQFNGGNRWFDKDVQMVVSKDGIVGGILEHSFMDGTIMKILAKTWGVNLRRTLEAIGEVKLDGNALGVVRLEWNLCAVAEQRIVESADFVDWMVENLDYKIHDFKCYGSHWLKSVKCSPNAFVQLALQLAAYKVHGQFVNNYSSAHLRLFRCGRTEVIRPLTTEAVLWVQHFSNIENSGSSLAKNQQLLSLFAEAMERQSQMTVEASHGQGFDLHLMCLLEAAKELTGSVPELFRDESYGIANNFHIVSSQVPRNQEDWFAAFGPDCEEGRGIFYSINPDNIDLSATSWRERNPSVGSEEFLQALVDVLHKMHVMMT